MRNKKFKNQGCVLVSNIFALKSIERDLSKHEKGRLVYLSEETGELLEIAEDKNKSLKDKKNKKNKGDKLKAMTSENEEQLIGLQKLSESKSHNSSTIDMARSLIKWYLRHQSWTDKQVKLVNSLIS